VKKIYLAGRMTGIPYFNFPKFDVTRDLLTELGYDVFSPADNDRRLLGKPENWMPSDADHDGSWGAWVTPGAPDLRTMLGQDLNWIAREADAIFLMNGWEHGSGTLAEFYLARALRLEFLYE
jgi:hypothetical protein